MHVIRPNGYAGFYYIIGLFGWLLGHVVLAIGRRVLVSCDVRTFLCNILDIVE